MSYLLVFLGAGVGGSLRHAVNTLAARAMRPDLPIGTFAVNVIGSLVAGMLANCLLPRGGEGTATRLFVLTGVLGGFTTFSAYSLEVARLMEKGSTSGAIAYALASVVLSVVAVFVGFTIARP